MSIVLGLGCVFLLWPHPKDQIEKPKLAQSQRREAIAMGILLAAFWPVLLVAALL